MVSLDTLKTRRTLSVNNINYDYFSLSALEKAGFKQVFQLPCSLKILLENLLRHEDNITVTQEDIQAILTWVDNKSSTREVAYRPARVLMQDFTGVPAVVDLAAMRDAVSRMGGNPDLINPLSRVDLVIDHSVQVDHFGHKDALLTNAELEMERNRERYEFLRWGQNAFQNFQLVPPNTGICHQINLEFLAKTIWTEQIDGVNMAFPDTLVGTDSHTTMINGLGVLGWGVGGIEAEAAMLGQPISMLIPEVIGVKLLGILPEGMTSTDLVLAITHILRKKGVVGKFVEFFGPGLAMLTLADRATVANMAPEYGATCGFFPIDQFTLDYLTLTGRDTQTVALVESYAKSQGLWFDENHEPLFTDIVEIDLANIKPSLSGPKRPQDKVSLADVSVIFNKMLTDAGKTPTPRSENKLTHGDVVIAAITSCTNTSNPSVLMAAGLLAKKAVEKGLISKPWVKASLAPGSQVVTRYLEDTGLQPYLDKLGFGLVGYGCTTCIGNSGPLPEAVQEQISKDNIVAAAVLSGNRNFEGRVHPAVQANWLASPPLVVAYALAGTTQINLEKDPLGFDNDNHPIFLKDIWPTNVEIMSYVNKITQPMFREQYADVFSGNEEWQAIQFPPTQTYAWKDDSTYIQHPPFFSAMSLDVHAVSDIKNARILAIFGDSITTDHISPAGSIKTDSPAGKYLMSKGVKPDEFNSLGARRGNHEVMMRGTFANIRIRNEMLDNVEGGFTKHIPSQDILPIYDVAMRYQENQIPLVIIAGKEYGTGSSRDWAAKGPKLLGVAAVLAESFERIHRSNLIGMGILPLQFESGVTRKTLQLTGEEIIHIENLTSIQPGAQLNIQIQHANGSIDNIPVLCRIDTLNEVEYYRHGGILQYVLRSIVKKSA